MRRWLCLVFALAGPFGHASAKVVIDGHIGADEWRGARHITDFRLTQPFTGKPATLRTEAWILPTPKGLAIAFRNVQPADVTWTRQRVQRDFEDQVDRDNVIIDFVGDGRTGYNFTVSSTGGVYDAVITNESQFNKDWDGQWKHAVSTTADSWSVEMLIPWYTAPMHNGVDGKRTIGLYLDRVVGSTGERFAWPVASYSQPRFLSDIHRVSVPAYQQALLAITPYVSGLYDHVHGRRQFREGADILWKPTSNFQLTAALNPDFGEVESDDLVVNFGATETYFSDKRPFFTENQGIFDFSLLDDNSQLIYTRRVGGLADDGSGPADINAAVKLNGSVGTTNYGVLAADENGDAGRFFAAARATHEFGTHTVGAMVTRVQHPWLDRDATVVGVDDHWRPDPQWTIDANLVGSTILQRGTSTRGLGATAVVGYDMGGGWRQQWLGMHFDDRLQVNDFGYLARNNFDYLHWEVRRRLTDLSPDSMYRTHDWRFRVDALDSDDRHLRLRRQFRVVRESELRNGGRETVQLNINSAGWDDLLTRGHGALFLPPFFDAYIKRTSPRHGAWAFVTQVQLAGGGLSGNRRIGYNLVWQPTLFITDALSVYVGPQYDHTPDWPIWRHDNLFGVYNEWGLQIDAGVDWNISPRQELRVKLQALGLDARLRQAYRVSDAGRAVATNDPVGDFTVRNMGLQIRYRYELAPLSYLYVVYARGGYAQDPYQRDSLPLLRSSFALRDSEQLLVKFSYRFDI